MDVLMEQEQWRLNNESGFCPKQDKTETTSNIGYSNIVAPEEHRDYHAEKDQGIMPRFALLPVIYTRYLG